MKTFLSARTRLALFNPEGQVLLMVRGSKHLGILLPPGGGVDASEDFDASMQREVQEEIQLPDDAVI